MSLGQESGKRRPETDRTANNQLVLDGLFRAEDF